MHTDFLKINSTQDVLDHLSPDDYSLIDHGWFHELRTKNYSSAILQDCRGLLFDTNGDLINRPIHHFDHANDTTDWNIEHMLTEKIDGHQLRAVYSKKHDGFRLISNRKEPMIAIQAELYMIQNKNIQKALLECFHDGITLCFEWVSPVYKNRIDYGSRKEFVLTQARYTNSGKYLRYEDIELLARKYSLAIPKFSLIDRVDEQHLEKIASLRDIEGYVVNFKNGNKLKIQTNYFKQS